MKKIILKFKFSPGLEGKAKHAEYSFALICTMKSLALKEAHKPTETIRGNTSKAFE